jgi:hypothetical protein
MKLFAFVLMTILSVSAFATDMADFVRLSNGSFYVGSVATGYRAQKITNFVAKGGFATFLTVTTQEKKKAWKEYVLTSGEFDGMSRAELQRISNNPLKQLEVAALLEIYEVYAIFKGNKLIGYFVEITDHVQATIYQDGAWYDVFLEANQTVTQVFEQSA